MKFMNAVGDLSLVVWPYWNTYFLPYLPFTFS